MEPLSPTTGRRSRLLGAGGSLLVLVAIVGFASRSGFDGAARTTPTRGFVDWAFSTFLVLFVLAVPVTVYAIFFSGERPVPTRERGFGANVVRNLLIFGFVLFAVAGYYYLHHHGRLHGLHLNFGAQGTGAKGSAHGSAAAQPLSFHWPVLAVGAGLVAATVAMWVTLRRQRKPYLRTPLEDAQSPLLEQFAASVADALDDLEAEPDARRAVVAAYARMESMLARCGLRRSPSETPLEYLQRALLELTSRGDAVETLTGLFQEARFSTHAISDGMKQAAIGALSAIRDDLAGAET